MINQSITIINKSGKVVSTGKHLTSVWKEARAAYKHRKAEFKALREAELYERQARAALQNISLSDEQLPIHQDHHSSRHYEQQPMYTARHESTGYPPPLDRGYSDSAYINDGFHQHHNQPPVFEAPERQLLRRNTEPPRPSSADSYDEHLAYGDLPPPLPLRNSDTELELRGKMSKLNGLLEEANCLQYSATAMIEHLQKNPDALAAVGLTLAEISTMATRLAPGALASMKMAFPAVIALLMSPEFLIAGGVAVGVTIVMLGGYKIIQKIKANKEVKEEDEAEDEVTELRELESEVSSIEMWRRGVADASIDGSVVSVEGEFITPVAERRLLDEGVIHPSQIKPLRRAHSERTHRTRPESEGTSRSKHKHRRHRTSTSDEKSTRSGSSSKHGKTKKKSVGGLRMLFARSKS